MKTIKLFSIFILVFAFGCQAVLPTNTNNASTQTLQSFTSTPSRTSTKTQTLTATPNPLFHTQCPEIVTKIPDGLELQGKIVLEDNIEPVELYFLDPSNNLTTNIANYNMWYGFAVSPNGMILAYQSVEDNTDQHYLTFIDSNNNILKTIPWHESWNWIAKWINDDQLALENVDSESAQGKEKQMVIAAPFEDTLKYINLDELAYPDYSSEIFDIPWIEYDPTLQRAIYSSVTAKQVLVNVENRQVMAEIPGIRLEPLEVAWSNDGNYVAVVGSVPNSSRDLYIISREGEVQRAHLNDYFYDILFPYQPSWSPNGKYVALWEADNLDDNQASNLIVLNTQTLQSTIYCISAVDYNSGLPTHSLLAPVWSPDSKQVVVQSYHGKEDDRVVLIDITTDAAVEIARNASPVGWMVNNP